MTSTTAAPHASVASGSSGEGVLATFFANRGWTPYRFQRDAWAAYAEGRSGLITVPTGAGKTYAAYGGPLGELAKEGPAPRGADDSLRVLYITPLRAVSRDIELALQAPVVALGLPIAVGSRTGDTLERERVRQRKRLPEVLVTTPESLTLLLTGERAERTFAGLRAVIVDEWHELMASKRGVQVELGLARLRRMAPRLRIWGLSATLAKPALAARQLVGANAAPSLVRADIERPIEVESLLPRAIERFPWSGHLGLAMLEPLLAWLDPEKPTLLFTNTRSQAERWFAEILKAKPEWAERLALHHGSIDRALRERIEAGVKRGDLTLVVCTSSLDLGVDFSPVERVVQIGSPKGIARLIQRAGRSGHRPGATCRVLCVPAHALELVEIAAARQAVSRLEIEERPTLAAPLDCLVQHLVTCAIGGGFDADALFEEVRTATSFAALNRADFDWCLELVLRGGQSLAAYPQFHRLCETQGRFHVRDRRIAQLHRLNVGTITADATVLLRLVKGRALGSIEEDFAARLRPGEVFLFAGRMLEFVRLRDLTAFARPARTRTNVTPHWNGSRFPLSTALSYAVRRIFDDARRGTCDEPEMEAARPLLEAQAARSVLPGLDEVLVESVRTEEGAHLFIYPFEGRLVHEGLAALVALRLGRIEPTTFAISINDYGFELLTRDEFPSVDRLSPELFSTTRLVEDLLESVQLGELALRQFREIARVSGLIVQKHLGGERSSRQLQAGTSLLWQVLREFEPENLLLRQADREVLDRQFEENRLVRTLDRLARGPLRIVRCAAPGPLAFPLIADRLGTTLSTETLSERLGRLTEAMRA